MKEVLKGLKDKGVEYLSVCGCPEKKCRVEFMVVGEKYLVAIPDEYLHQFLGKNLLSRIVGISLANLEKGLQRMEFNTKK